MLYIIIAVNNLESNILAPIHKIQRKHILKWQLPCNKVSITLNPICSVTESIRLQFHSRPVPLKWSIQKSF